MPLVEELGDRVCRLMFAEFMGDRSPVRPPHAPEYRGRLERLLSLHGLLSNGQTKNTALCFATASCGEIADFN